MMIYNASEVETRQFTNKVMTQAPAVKRVQWELAQNISVQPFPPQLRNAIAYDSLYKVSWHQGHVEVVFFNQAGTMVAHVFLG